MMEVRLTSEPAPGRSANEDSALAVGSLVAVFDGVTVPDGLEAGCTHGTRWYVERLTSRVVETYMALSDAPLPSLLERAIDLVRTDHGSHCDLGHPGTPAASLCMLRTANTQVEYLVLSDTVLVLDREDQVEIVTDLRFTRAVAPIRETALLQGALGSTDQILRTRWATEQKWQHVNQPGGYWIAAADPRAAHEAVTGTAEVRRAALLTDGASCAVERFGLLDWTGLLDLLTEAGPGELIRQVRAAELADPTGSTQPRYKRHDDATAAICLFDMEER